MNGTTVLAIALAIAASGCATTSTMRTSAAERAMMTDGDWYREAIEEALHAYERSVFTGAQIHRPRCFDEMLHRALADRGLTPRGLDVYSQHHPDLARHLAHEVRPRLDRARRNDPAIARCTLGTSALQVTALYDVRSDSEL